jgi:4-amino-4-deoxy-L-arabinose transferase-like glycosyltransferase
LGREAGKVALQHRKAAARMAQGEVSDQSYRRMLVAIVVLGVVARIAMSVRGFGVLDDPDNYLPLARSLAEGRGYVFNGRLTAYRPPLYPLVLAPFVGLLGNRGLAWGIAGLHVALGAMTVAATGLAARRWGLSSRRALIAAAIVACDPVLVAQCRSVMTETLSAFLVAATLALLAEGTWRGALAGGVGFGLASLCRPSLLPAAGLTALAALAVGPGSWRQRLLRAGVLALATVATLAPWAWRNARVFGEPVWTTTHGGYTLALANNPVYYEEVLHGPPGAVWSGENQARWVDAINTPARGLSEPAADRYFRAQGLRMLTARPADFARASLARWGRFWSVAPSGSVYPRWLRVTTAVWTAPLWLTLIVGLTRRGLWRWPEISAPMILVALSVVHLIFWTDLRMRAPIVPAIALIAAAANVHFGRLLGIRIPP